MRVTSFNEKEGSIDYEKVAEVALPADEYPLYYFSASNRTLQLFSLVERPLTILTMASV